MKKIIFIFFLVTALSSINGQFVKFNSRDVVFIKSLIAESRFKQIWLTNQSSWKLSRPTTFVNLTEILIILGEGQSSQYTSGLAFINGQEYDINYLGGQFFYEKAFLYKIINMHYDGGGVMLDDYSEWDIEDEDYKEKIAKWFIPKYILLTQDKRFILEPQSQNKIRIKKVEE